jgi:hypothetical protein
MMRAAPEAPLLQLDHLRPQYPPLILERAQQVNHLLWTFEWTYPDGQSRGELHVDTDHGLLNLILEVWVPDNDDADDRTTRALAVTRAIDTRPAAQQIRATIHWFLCHEADEQMLFDGARPFDPHCMPGQDRKADGTFIRSERDRTVTKTARALLGVI